MGHYLSNLSYMSIKSFYPRVIPLDNYCKIQIRFNQSKKYVQYLYIDMMIRVSFADRKINPVKCIQTCL